MLTTQQQKVLDFVRAGQERHGWAPTLGEIRKHFGFKSVTAAVHHLDALEKKGALRRVPGKARCIAFPGERPRLAQVPLYGTVPAGFPSADEQASEGCVTVDLASINIPRHARAFALKVRGDSMIGAHILPGDIVILEFREARDQDIVAALIDGETTLKRFLRKKGGVYLKAENARYPQLIPALELVIQGVVIGLLRKM